MTLQTPGPPGPLDWCAACGAAAPLDDADRLCPRCGPLLAWFREYLERTSGFDPASITPQTPVRDLLIDSLDSVEIIMEVEGRFSFGLMGLTEPGGDTVGDWLGSLSRGADRVDGEGPDDVP